MKREPSASSWPFESLSHTHPVRIFLPFLAVNYGQHSLRIQLEDLRYGSSGKNSKSSWRNPPKGENKPKNTIMDLSTSLKFTVFFDLFWFFTWSSVQLWRQNQFKKIKINQKSSKSFWSKKISNRKNPLHGEVLSPTENQKTKKQKLFWKTRKST